ncbi:uncharacterized protein b6 [Drosophila virilis]|uniref:Pentraxin (PTX) domain-containing protein n=1 Tax=Drosophila virilis TaxID=7244 RepID=B4MB43_DROVI|nr:uncharacterized protein LOC6634691 [Drosophila virilis]EDW66452.1 uncharacterized protein Dvir_GJ16042 [Drosophila virilis]
MVRLHNRLFWPTGCGAGLLLITLLGGVRVSFAWKPIASGSPITSYSLKQSHPGEASSSHELTTSYGQFGGDQKEEDDLLLARAAVVNGVETGITHPITLADDHENHYESYSLKDDVVEEPSLSFPRSPLYVADRCSVKKFAFNQDGAVEYGNELPELDQFTLCFWMRFTNHSGDHVMLTYQVKKEPREIQIWVANAQNSSFLSMAIKGQQMYRLNYPLRMRQWHHMCSSWNGKTGEWQVWLKAERIGRGFHNSLVGHKIPAKGKLRSGGSSVTGEVSHGLHFEVTLVQIYRVALSAGKAHRDHKHHHVHHVDHDGQEVSSTARAPPMINRPQPMHSLLASGQIPTRVRINLAGSGPTQKPPNGGANGAEFPPQQQAITVNTNFVNGQINAGSRLVAQQLLGILPIAQSRPGSPPLLASEAGRFQMLSNSANVQFIDETETHIQFKRHAANTDATTLRTATNDKKLRKRGLVLLDDGSVVDDGLGTSSEAFSKYNGLADFGGQQFKQDLTLKMTLEEEISSHDREPAEEEVKAVMSICSNCDPEPFQGAIVFSWKNVEEHMNNTLKGLSVGTCGNF